MWRLKISSADDVFFASFIEGSPVATVWSSADARSGIPVIPVTSMATPVWIIVLRFMRTPGLACRRALKPAANRREERARAGRVRVQLRQD
jgi:hypothetical protein